MKKKMLCLVAVLVIAILALSGCKIKNYNQALININDGEDKITLGYANFAFKYNQSIYDESYGSYYGASLWTEDMTGSGQTFADEMKQEVIDTLEEQYVIVKHAEELGVELTDDDKKAIEEATQKFLDDNSNSALNKLGADKDTVNKLLTDLTYVSKVQQALEAKAQAEGAVNDTTTASDYVNNQVAAWKNEVTFTVDDALLDQLQVTDQFTSASSSTANTSTTSSSQ